MNIEVVNTGDQDTKLLGAAPVDAVAATATVTDGNLSNYNVNQTLTVGTKVYKFVAGPVAVEGDILIGASADASLNNLVNAINNDQILGVPGTDHKVVAAHPLVAAAPVGAHATVLTARTKGVSGNAIALSKVGAFGTVSGAFLQNGIDGTPGTPTQIEIYNGQPYICIAPATIITTGAWKKLTIASL